MQQKARGGRARGALVGFMATVLAVSLMVPGIALADPSAAEKQAEAQAALASLNSMQEKLSKAADAYDDALAAQKDAEAKRDDAQARIDEASAQIADLQDRLGSRARSMYRSGGSSALDLLLGATSFRSFATNWDLLNSINESDAELVQQTKDLRAEVQEQEAVLAEQERIAAQKASEALHTKDETASTMAAMQSTYDNLSAEAAALVEQERAAQVAAYEAQAQATVDASADQAQQGSNNGNGGNNGGESSGGGSVNPPAPDYDEPIAGSVVGRAYSQLGKPYGYTDPSYGAGPSSYDCSGFVSFCLSGSYSRMGSTLTFMNWPQVSDPQPGDVAVNAGHCGIYIGGNQMIHAATYGVGVVQGPVQPGMIIVRPW